MGLLPRDEAYFIQHLCDLGRQLRGAAISARRSVNSLGNQPLSLVARETAADTIYELDTHTEPVLEEFCRQW